MATSTALAWLRRRADLVLAGALAVLLVTEVVRFPDASLRLAVPSAVLATLPLALRRGYPLPVFLAVTVGIGGVGHFAPGLDNDSMGFVIAFLVNLYSLGRHTRGQETWVGAFFVLVAMVAFVADDVGTAVDPGDVGFTLGFVGGPWAAGLAIRLRSDREAALVEQAEQAVARERARIARELHDVVAHAISVTVVQARGARAMLGRDEASVRRALDAIEQTNTAALSDMRRLLAVLRDTDGTQPGPVRGAGPGPVSGTGRGAGRAAPQPSLGNLEELVAQVRAAGLPVELVVTGEPGPVPPGVDLSAYRIVQEALTNVIKHAGPGARARVHLTYSPDAVALQVGDDGLGRSGGGDGTGHGLLGIRERVAVVGGRVVAGPTAQGGFAVDVHLPYAFEPDRGEEAVHP